MYRLGKRIMIFINSDLKRGFCQNVKIQTDS